jgi:hypothetical protein
LPGFILPDSAKNVSFDQCIKNDYMITVLRLQLQLQVKKVTPNFTVHLLIFIKITIYHWHCKHDNKHKKIKLIINRKAMITCWQIKINCYNSQNNDVNMTAYKINKTFSIPVWYLKHDNEHN